MKILVSKLDASKRQLETSIKLFLSDGDPVSIHTLAAAGHSLLRDIGRGQGVQSVVKDVMIEHIRPERRDEYVRVVNMAANYFKHGNLDATKLLEFNPSSTTWLLWDAIEMYFSLTSEKPAVMLVFKGWFFLEHPELLDDKTRSQLAAIGHGLDPRRRSLFLEMLPVFEKRIHSA